MRNIALLFRHDLRRATRNVIAIVVLAGVVIIPSFFAWFNVLSSWNPFGNVKNLKVAVANSDEGYRSDLFPLRINVGEQVISSLRANTDLDWVFTTKEGAIEGTESGQYYAALVLPRDFSQRMMTFLAPGAKPAQIEYYTNEKENAIAPVITGEASTDVATQINESFTKTLNDVGLSVISSLAYQIESADAQVALARLDSSITVLAAQLRSAADTATMFSGMIGSSKQLIESASALTSESIDALRSSAGAIRGGLDAAQALKSTLDSATAALSAAFASSVDSYRHLAERVDELYASLDDQAQAAADALDALAGQVDAQITHYEALRNELEAQRAQTEDPLLIAALSIVIDEMDAALARQEALRDRILTAADHLADGVTVPQEVRQEILDLVAQARGALESAQAAYTQNLHPKLERLAGTLSSINSSFISVGDDLLGIAQALSSGSGSLLGGLTAMQEVISTVAADLNRAAGEFDVVAAAVQKAAETGDISEISAIIGSNPAILAGELTTPVSLKTIPVFKMDNFGTQMTPFYSVLGLWVGALLLSVLISTEVAREDVESGKPLTLPQSYFGRYGIFAILAFLQSTIVYLGLMFFVGVEPKYPFLLLLAGWVMSFVFSAITYTMVVTFGEAGKALSVLLLVVQISGAGGAYPLAVLPEWFQNVSPFLPATHATDAVRSALAGIYENDYWISIGWLLAFLVPVLLMGLLLRLPLIKVNDDLTKALESTKIM